MSALNIFRVHLALGYLAWLFCIPTYALPRLRSMHPTDAQRALATLHSFRFIGLVFLVPDVVGADLPGGFATPAACGDLATSVLALLALATFGVRPLFWCFVVAFNLVGAGDLILDTAHAVHLEARREAMLRRPIAPMLFALTLPVIAVIAAQTFGAVLGAFWVSRLGTAAVAGVSLVLPLLVLMNTMSNLTYSAWVFGGALRFAATGGGAWGLRLHGTPLGLLFAAVSAGSVLFGGVNLAGFLLGSPGRRRTVAESPAASLDGRRHSRQTP